MGCTFLVLRAHPWPTQGRQKRVKEAMAGEEAFPSTIAGLLDDKWVQVSHAATGRTGGLSCPTR